MKFGFNEVGKRVITFIFSKLLDRFIRENISTHHDHINAPSANRSSKCVPLLWIQQSSLCWISESAMSRTHITKHDKTAAYFVSRFAFASNEVLPWNGSALTRHFAYLRCSMVWSFSFEICSDASWLFVIPRYSGKFLSSKFITARATLWNPSTFSSMLIWEFARCWVVMNWYCCRNVA